MHVNRSGIRKEKVADSKVSGYVWMGRQSYAIVCIHFMCTHYILFLHNVMFAKTNFEK